MVSVGARVEDVASGRSVLLERVELGDEWMRVFYRLEPGQRSSGEHLMWSLAVEDDIGTKYYVLRGMYVAEEAEIRGDQDVEPPAPPGASSLTFVVYDIDADGEHRERGRVTVPLAK